MPSHETDRNSKIAGWAQTVLLCFFAAAAFLPHQTPMFRSSAAGLAGNVSCAVGVLLVLAGVYNLRRVIQIAPAPRADGQLMRSGIHGIFRHPIYTGIVVCVIGLFLQKPTLLLAIAGVAVLVYLVAKVRFEEKLLLARYPDYAVHKAKTIGLLPGL